uniref:Pyruvate kinase n=1 Tax=Romanomermis culicivorax TaxID=13658 RepID=A0A915JQT9_ROMCU
MSPSSDHLPPLPMLKGGGQQQQRRLQRKFTIEQEHAGAYFFQEQKLKSQPDATQLEHLCNLRIDEPLHFVRKTGLICTLGPASRSVEMVEQLILNGMNIARLNFSHGSHEYHGETIANIRAAVSSFTSPPRVVAIALDTKGPEIRTGVWAAGVNAEHELKKGEKISLTTDDNFKTSCTSVHIYVDYKNITKVVKTGSKIYIDDGLISLEVLSIENDRLVCEVENGGLLGSKKGVNLPGTSVDLPAVSSKDIEDLKFGVEQQVDIIFASFIRNADGVRTIRQVLGEQGKHIKIISKIENHEGIENIDEIIKESDGIMVARGDLGIEIPAEKVFLAQKMMIAKCNQAGKPVICATQMLESMIKKPRPTRAEGSDVANAVLDGADCVMLSGETAKGDYPLETVQMMHNICREAESAIYHVKYFEEIQRLTMKPMSAAQTIAVAATSAAVSCHASAIVLTTTTGKTAGLISKFRPPCPILCVTRDPQVARQLHLFRGVFPILYPFPFEDEEENCADRDADWSTDVDNRIQYTVDLAKSRGFVRSADTLIVVTGWRKGAGSTNTLRIMIAD